MLVGTNILAGWMRALAAQRAETEGSSRREADYAYRPPRSIGIAARRLVRTTNAGVFLLALVWVLLWAGSSAWAGTERFDYDPLGRLIRVIDEQGRVTEYAYDPAGNILEVRTRSAGTVDPPVVTSVTPSSLRRGTSVDVQLTGTGLTGAQLTSPESQLSVSNFRSTPTTASFSLSAANDATLGNRAFTLSSAAGTAGFTMRVEPLLPRMEASPNPLAIPPDSRDRRFTVRLTNTDTVAHTASISTLDATVAAVSPATLAFTAGAQELTASIRGLKEGLTTLRITSPTLGVVLVPIYVTPEFAGINSSYALSVGVVKDAPSTPKETTISPIVSPAVRIAFGRYIERVDPGFVIVGAAATTVTVSGAGLGDVTGVQIKPGDGLTVGAATRAIDGKSVRFDVAAATNAATTIRQVILTGPNSYLPVSADADRLRVVKPPPVVDSIDPIVVAQGATGVVLTIRGRNLQDASSITTLPATGIAIGAFPNISADGTTITTAISVGPVAALGVRPVVVVTASGSSEIAATPANSLNIVERAGDNISPIASPTVSVLKEEAPSTNTTPTPIFSGLVGVSKGAVVTAMEPATGTIGSNVTLILRGNGLSGVDRVQFTAPEGLTIVSITAAASTVSVPITIAENAPQTIRGVRVFAGTTEVPFTDPASALFRVTPRLPVIDSVEPLQVEIGAPAISLVVRGRNFQNAQSITLAPGGGVEIQAIPTVNGDGTSAVVTLRALSGATPGARAVVLTTLAGPTSATLSSANTITLVTKLGDSVTPLVSPLVGVEKATATVPGSGVETFLASPIVSVQKAEIVVPETRTNLVVTRTVTVGKGTFGLRTTATPLVRNGTGSLTVAGFALGSVNAVEFYPPSGITAGPLQKSPDGSTLTVPLTIANDAAIGARQLILRMANNDRVVFIDPAGDRFSVAAAAPRIDSITPIVIFTGEAVTMTIRGENLSLATGVSVEPSAGIVVGPISSVNAAGTEITVPIGVPMANGEGSFVVRVTTPGGTTSGVFAPANTFNVYIPP